jgi:hypothetical protein
MSMKSAARTMSRNKQAKLRASAGSLPVTSVVMPFDPPVFAVDSSHEGCGSQNELRPWNWKKQTTNTSAPAIP